MKEFKAVEFMRKQKRKLEKKYAKLPMEDVVERIHIEVKNSPVWRGFLKKHSVINV